MAATQGAKPRVLVTRKMMPDVEARIASLFDATLNAADSPLTREDALARAGDYDAILLTSFDKHFGKA